MAMNNPQSDKEAQDKIIDDKQMEVASEKAQVADKESFVEQDNGWETQAKDLHAKVTKEQAVGQDGWPKWQDVRQSKRIKAYGGA